MDYLSAERSRERRADPRVILPECRSVLVLAVRYADPKSTQRKDTTNPSGRVAAYAWGDDYHEVLSKRLQALVTFIESRTGRSVPHRYYTDTGPILERDLAQRAGLGWVGKNTCLINPKHGSYFLLAEILLGLELEFDSPFTTDHCGTCTRCIDACPTQCILPDRTLDARRCISYLTIELKGDVPEDLRLPMADWVFGCDVCQTVCPWNRFAEPEGDPAFAPRDGVASPDLIGEMSLTREGFNRKFKNSPVLRAKWRGYLRNVAIALGNSGEKLAAAELGRAAEHPEAMVRRHASWAMKRIEAGNDA